MDGIKKTLLATVIVSDQIQENSSDNLQADNSPPFVTLYEVYDYGIINTFVYMSNPRYITSVAKGETLSLTRTLTVAVKLDAIMTTSLSGAAGIVKEAMKGSFSLSGSNSYTTSAQITLTGPGENSNENSRTF